MRIVDTINFIDEKITAYNCGEMVHTRGTLKDIKVILSGLEGNHEI